MDTKLKEILHEYEEISQKLKTAEVINNPEEFESYKKKYDDLHFIVEAHKTYQDEIKSLKLLKESHKDEADAEKKKTLETEISELEEKIHTKKEELKKLLGMK